MITINKKGGQLNTSIIEFCGLSTDDKPIENVVNGSKFKEIDTSNLYKYDISSQEWILQPKQSSSGGDSPIEVMDLTDLYGDIIIGQPLTYEFVPTSNGWLQVLIAGNNMSNPVLTAITINGQAVAIPNLRYESLPNRCSYLYCRVCKGDNVTIATDGYPSSRIGIVCFVSKID